MTFAKAKRRDEAIDGLPDRAAVRAERAVIVSSGYGELEAASLEHLEAPQITKNTRSFVVGGQALEDLADHEVEQTQRLDPKLRVEPLRLWSRDVVQVVHPHRGVDNNHEIIGWLGRATVGSRSDRHAM